MARHKRLQTGFTLVELLIVVIILAILAAIVVPQFSSTTNDANQAAYDANLAALRSVVELYRQQHNGVYPGAVVSTGATCVNGAADGGAIGQASFLSQLSRYTNALGQACTGFDAAQFRFGPYLKEEIPVNPLGTTNAVVVVNTGVLGLTSGGSGGWRFDSVTGELIGDQ